MSFKRALLLAAIAAGAASGRFFMYFLFLPFPLPVPLFGFLAVLWLACYPSMATLAGVVAVGLLEDGLAFSPMGTSSASLLITYVYARWHRRMFALEGRVGGFLLCLNAVVLGYLAKGFLLFGQGGFPNKDALVFVLWVHIAWSLLLALLGAWLLSTLEEVRETEASKLVGR